MLEIIGEIIKEEFPLGEVLVRTDIIQVNIKNISTIFPFANSTLNFEIFLTDEGLVVQRFTAHSHRAQRLVTDLNDPDSFKKVTQFIHRQKVMENRQ